MSVSFLSCIFLQCFGRHLLSIKLWETGTSPVSQTCSTVSDSGVLMWYWIFHYCVGRSCGHLLTHVCVFSLLCLSTVFNQASDFVKNKINIRDLASWDVKKVKQMGSMLSSSSADWIALWERLGWPSVP